MPFIILFLSISVFFAYQSNKLKQEYEEINNNINHLNKQISNNKNTIDEIQNSIEEYKNNNALLNKEYEVWVHQNQKLEKILP